KYHTFKLLGPYAEDGMTYYLNGWPYDDDPDKTGTSYIVSIFPDKNNTPTIALDVRNIGTNDYRISLTHTGPIETDGSNYYSYYALNTADPNATEIYYELNTNTSAAVSGTGYSSFMNYYNKAGTATYEQVTSFFFRRREDRVDTSELLTTIRKMAENDLLVWNDHYDSNTYDAFIATVEEAVSLYTRYTGLSVVATTRQTVEATIADIIRDMMDLSAVLQINTEGNEGTDISYFSANMYRWNEDQMNLITKTKEEANIAANSSYVNKGFYFTSGKNVISNPPIYSKWNGGTGWRESVNNVLHDAQRFSISSGLASKKLSESGSPLANSTTIVEPGLWEVEDMYTSDGKTQIKEVYNDVQIPFMYDKETGYYTLNSNTNSVFFENDPEDGAILKISEKPSVFTLGAGEAFLTEDPDTYVQNKFTTYGLYDGYSAGFQPFVSLTNKEWKGFAASATQYDNRNDMVDGYLIQGIPQNANTPYYGKMGNAVYGFGMALSIDFELTNDGTTNGRPITFDFGGDDDVWVYIDDELVLDIGGTHGAIYGTIDFSTGTVSVRYNETSRIRDMNGKYGLDESLYELSTDYTQSHGNKLQFGSVMALKDGSTPVRMYQENLYTGAVNGNAASADKIAAFSAEGTHTLKLFYMDRGRNRTNCYISFNLPRPDTLKVEKNIADTYGYMTESGMEITDEPISEKLMASLLEETFALVLKKNGTPVVSDYTVMVGNTPISSGKTDTNGTFTLKGNQAAHFTNLDLGEGSTYTVEELLPDGSTKWGTPAYTYAYIHADSQTETCIGNSYTFQKVGTDGTETLTFSCTNRYADYTILDPEAQTVVLDYGKPIDIEVVRNAVVTGASELIVREATVVSASMAEDSQDYGTLYATDGKTLRFTPEKMLDKVLGASCSLKLTFEDGGERQVKIPIYLMPATSVYYETDFATSVFDLKAVGSEEYKYQWDTTGSSHYGEVQDPGNVGDQIYDFVIEKESVPSNAFFVDFDGEGYEERYGNQVQYGNVNFDLVKNYMINKNRADLTNTKINTADETYELYLSANNDPSWYDRYIQTALDTGEVNKYSTPLFYSPGENDYVQVRFRMVNCDVVGAENFGFSFAYHRNGDSDVVSDLAAKCILEDETTDLLAGNYVTVTLSLKDAAMYQAASVIYSFRFTFHNVEYLDATSKICIDYLYVGPLTDKDGTQGQALSS
ncbi:MAG: fibro-slime domain-containing protein, partial [Oscillospiraceae bacterium]|nr:fibro-slime domain-containing protein [Oscillospiraceae bacterium]